MYVPWLAAAAAYRACEFVTVGAFNDPLRSEVVPGVAVVRL